jgi:circadian clock protein KaiB
MPAKKKATPNRKGKPSETTAEFEALLRQAPNGKNYVLRLFVTGTTPRSTLAIRNIRALCDEHLAGRYELEVVDIYQQPKVASGEQIIAAPTLIRELPKPTKRMVGDLSNTDRVLIALDLREAGTQEDAPGHTQWIKV